MLRVLLCPKSVFAFYYQYSINLIGTKYKEKSGFALPLICLLESSKKTIRALGSRSGFALLRLELH